MKKVLILLAAAMVFLLAGCSSVQNTNSQESANTNNTSASYHQISQDEAMQMMAKDDGHVIVDVRRQDEYDAGHIAGAILIPNESIDKERPAELPDLNQVILIYCRTGNRSKQASLKLADMGYTNIYEFGGIMEWKGDVITGSEPGSIGKPASVTLRSFSGGGPEYTLVFEGPEDVISCTQQKDFGSNAGKVVDGAPYDVIFTFTGLKEGHTSFIIQERSPIAASIDALYYAEVDKDLNVKVEKISEKNTDAPDAYPVLVIKAGDAVFYANFEDNSSAEAFKEKLKEGALTVKARDYGNFEKVGELPWSLVRNDEQITTQPGDVILYQGNQITIYYDTNTWSFTKLAHIEGATRESLLEAFGSGDVEISFYLEWDE